MPGGASLRARGGCGIGHPANTAEPAEIGGKTRVSVARAFPLPERGLALIHAGLPTASANDAFDVLPRAGWTVRILRGALVIIRGAVYVFTPLGDVAVKIEDPKG